MSEPTSEPRPEAPPSPMLFPPVIIFLIVAFRNLRLPHKADLQVLCAAYFMFFGRAALKLSMCYHYFNYEKYWWYDPLFVFVFIPVIYGGCNRAYSLMSNWLNRKVQLSNSKDDILSRPLLERIWRLAIFLYILLVLVMAMPRS